MNRIVFLLLLVAPALACAQQPRRAVGGADDGATVVILVRHAEKASETADDPSLSATGRARSEALARALADAGITRAIVSQRRRTHETATPLLAALGVVPDTISIAGTVPAHASAVAARIRTRHAGQTVLVVGHSNTISPIIAELGAGVLPDICDAAYAAMFIVVMRDDGPARLIRSRFGAADPPAADACHGPEAR